ncbi:MAG TPA: VOC family protein [Vicinamibacterales bacterium]|nr:VOC family protein [Vicinamibacterales bacterium]
MRMKGIWIAAALAAAFVSIGRAAPRAQDAALPAPGFHHLHLNSTNPENAAAWYAKTFPVTSQSTWGGMTALKSPNNVLILLTRVEQPPATQPQTAFWHFGWHVLKERETMARLRDQGVTLLPLYTGDPDRPTVNINSDTYPGTGGLLGLTRPQLEDAKKNGVKPAGGAGFAYIRGPDDALIEVQGDMPAERFNHVHMYHEHPFCAQLWYQKHLNVAPPQGRRGAAPAEPRTEANCRVPRTPDKTFPALELNGMYRAPQIPLVFGDVSMGGYMSNADQPLVSTRGHLADHVGLSVANLDAWAAKLRGEGVTFLDQPHKLGDTRALMIEGPSKEAIELVEVK